MSELPKILLDFASAPSLQDWEVEDDSDCLTLEYDATLGKRVLVKKGPGFDPAVTYKRQGAPPLDWSYPHYELAVRLHPESFIYIYVSDKAGKERTLLYSSAIPPGLNEHEEFMIPLDKEVSDGNWHSLTIDLPEHMEQARWPDFVKVNWLRLRGAVMLAGIRGCDDKNPLIESAIASPYVVHYPAPRSKGEWVYDFFDYFEEADSSDYRKKPHCVILPDGRLISGGVAKRGIFQHPPLPGHGPSRLLYPPIRIPDHIQELRLDFFIGILDERPDTGEQQVKFSKDLFKGDAVKFRVRVNGKSKLDKRLNSVGWVPYSLPIELPTDGELVVEFITDAMGDLTFNWAAWGEPRLVGIRAVQKRDVAVIAPKRPAKGTDLRISEHQVDFAVITALEKEAKAVVSRLESPRIERFEDKDIRTYHCGTIPIQDTDHAYRVVVVLLPSMGEISAANAVTDTIARWNPRFVLMVGIAGGIPQDDLDLGDVVVADQIIGYEYGRLTEDGIEPRDRVYPVSALLLDRVRNFWDESWAQQVNVPRPDSATRVMSKLFIGPIASGNKVIASTEFRQRLKTRWPKLVALEMEGEGVFAAVFDRPQIRNTLVIRGICDMADERKADEWQEYAANAAAAFAASFLESRPVEPQR